MDGCLHSEVMSNQCIVRIPVAVLRNVPIRSQHGESASTLETTPEYGLTSCGFLPQNLRVRDDTQTVPLQDKIPRRALRKNEITMFLAKVRTHECNGEQAETQASEAS